MPFTRAPNCATGPHHLYCKPACDRFEPVLAIGAKPVVRAYLDRSVEVPVEREGPFLDVDTPDAYEQVFGRGLPTVSQ